VKSIIRYLKAYRFQSIFLRNLLAILVLVNLPILLLVLLYFSHFRMVTNEEISKANLDTLQRSSNIVDKVFHELESFTFMLSNDHSTKMFVFLEDEQLKKGSYISDIVQNIKLYCGTFEYVESIYVYSEDNHLIIVQDGLQSFTTFPDKSWLAAYQQMTDATFMIDTRLKNDYYPYYVSMVYPIKNSRKKEGAVVININVEKLAQLADVKQSGSELFLLGPDGRLFYASDVRKLDQGSVSFADQLQGIANMSSRIINTDTGPSYLSYVQSRQFNWNYVLLSPASVYSSLLSDYFLLEIAVMTLLIALAVSFVLTRLTYAPVSNLLNALEESGTELTYIDTKNRSEVAFIKGVISQMQDRNDTLENALEVRLKMLNETQLVMLQNQINPHFIYNTLDTINWIVLKKLGDNNEVSDMITSLAALLRTSLSRVSYLVSVEEETEHAKLYLSLITRRYRDRLQIYWEVDERIKSCKMLKLSLQPLIENALQHGLRTRRYRGMISIRILPDGEQTMLITVEDDGAGMENTAMRALSEELEQNVYIFDSEHIGIHNVHRRLRLLFGYEYGLTLEKPSKGFRIVMHCPIIR
jgi:two-component system sensor histidine kinase YesM